MKTFKDILPVLGYILVFTAGAQAGLSLANIQGLEYLPVAAEFAITLIFAVLITLLYHLTLLLLEGGNRKKSFGIIPKTNGQQ